MKYSYVVITAYAIGATLAFAAPVISSSAKIDARQPDTLGPLGQPIDSKLSNEDSKLMARDLDRRSQDARIIQWYDRTRQIRSTQAKAKEAAMAMMNRHPQPGPSQNQAQQHPQVETATSTDHPPFVTNDAGFLMLSPSNLRPRGMAVDNQRG